MNYIYNIVFQILNFFKNIFGNYGMAIIATTVIIKLILLPLSIKQEHHMRLQNELQPKINELNKKYPKKGAEYNKELTELYKRENANPLLGCFPVLIQLPIFIALYHTFRYTDFSATTNFLWFNLTKPDKLFMIGTFSFNLLPILGAILQIAQQKVMTMGNNGEIDEKAKTMQKTMYAMPVIMLFLFYNLSSALNLYFTVNIFLGLIQSYVFLKMRKKKD